MTANRLMILSGVSFVLFGLLLGASGSEASKNLWGGLSTASLGTFALAMVADALANGRIRFQFDVIERDKRPRLFLAAISLVAFAGLVVMGCAVWVLFFRGR